MSGNAPGRPPARTHRKQATNVPEKSALRPREEKLVSLLAQGNITVSEACRQCGFNGRTSSIRERIAPGGDLRAHVFSRMQALGMTLDVALIKVRQKLDAKETKFFADKGKVKSTRTVDAHAIQLEAAETMLKLHGAYVEKPSIEGIGVIINVYGVDPAWLKPDGNGNGAGS